MDDDLIKFLIDVFDQINFVLNVDDFVVVQTMLVQPIVQEKKTFN